jgi:hypothetical protein
MIWICSCGRIYLYVVFAQGFSPYSFEEIKNLNWENAYRETLGNKWVNMEKV